MHVCISHFPFRVTVLRCWRRPMQAACHVGLAGWGHIRCRQSGWRRVCPSSDTPALGALQSACRILHSPTLERNAGALRTVKRLPRGMSPFRPSRAAAKLEQPHGAVDSQSDGSRHHHHGLFPLTPSEGAPSLSATPSEQLPPWPVDAFEFNAAAVKGGHDIRLAWKTIFPLSDSATAGVSANESAAAVPDAAPPLLASASGSTPKRPLLTPHTIRRLKTAEETAEAQAALCGGGWVCTGCWSIVLADCSDEVGGSASRSTRLAAFPCTICPVCRTLRHDAHTWSYIASLRLRSDLWKCECCGEANTRAAANCRCCGVTRTTGVGTAAAVATADTQAFVRRTIAVEVDSCPIGHIIVTRNRTTRWRCGVCKEINSLQMALCRNCARERFAVTVSCPTCDVPRVLSNAVVFGGGTSARATRGTDCHATLDPLSLSCAGAAGAAGGGHTATPDASLAAPLTFPERTFDPENCYTPNSTQITCLQCHSPLHGGRVAIVNTIVSWWCACGVVNSVTAYSCLRCRLPRALESPEKLRALLRSAVENSASQPLPLSAHDAGAASRSSAASPTWDFRYCTNWMCDLCCGVNTASYQVVAESHSSPSSDETCPDNTKRSRRLLMRHGDAACRHCGAPWHHHVLQEGNSWRCACHALNSCTDALCTSCGLPALDKIRPDVISSWSKGDWRCQSCGSLCYRGRQQCSCGTFRPSARLSSVS
ncbi:conserved hypothetical protein [Leishmania braziliensis MHOM/BR/75/M2904]|uniref:RanBP2-type domain-containing protein n=2 Tax=Leishmania braziliensis TaxID=5660 RepID=A4HBU1_LEIBR|nr:conserved hypothetical protein [Leishmania braziliensis MHOM/BR/75/M2904]KAI5690509.1 hypothetical protein MNV84_03602 [Leishmania braziliensis]CAJ2472507.1 unnamed protein product [Leishmania braziliensis]CAM38884.1 conserved hypothetical protein [Leishmania braziliensis MHOM/BR/75/M2904]